jgi:uncharacterized membrane protein YecN with MAPEG domain
MAVERWTITTHREGDVHPPSITAAYLAVLALLYAGLSLQVVRLRWKFRVAFGDSGNDELRNAIRAHSHFAEYVPIIAVMVAMLEIAGLPTMRVHLLMGALLIARLLHPFGMYAKPRTTRFQITRVDGMVITTIVMISAAALILGSCRWGSEGMSLPGPERRFGLAAPVSASEVKRISYARSEFRIEARNDRILQVDPLNHYCL